MLETGATLPEITVADDAGVSTDLRSFVGSPLVLYFYPKDDTPGCTNEATQFRDLFEQFERRNVRIVGVSRDGVDSHATFKAKYELPYSLLADVDSALSDAFGTVVERTANGKTSIGVQRATFYFDADGTLAHVWPNVSVDGHAEDVLSKI